MSNTEFSSCHNGTVLRSERATGQMKVERGAAKADAQLMRPHDIKMKGSECRQRSLSEREEGLSLRDSFSSDGFDGRAPRAWMTTMAIGTSVCRERVNFESPGMFT